MIDREYKFNQSTVKLLFGDILDSRAEVIISSDDSYLSMGGGVSWHIAQGAGGVYRELVAKHSPVPLGDVAVTEAGDLVQKYVFHCVTLGILSNESECFNSVEEQHAFIIQHAVDKCFRLMQSISLTSIAFPLIGAGVAGIPVNTVAKFMAASFAKNCQRTNRALSIELYLYDRFGVMTEMDYIPVFESFAVHSAWGRFIGGKESIEMEENAASNVSAETKPGDMNHKVFISYSTKNTAEAEEIQKVLKDNGISYWIDKDGMHSNGSFKGILVDAIKAAKVVVFLSSKASNASQYVIKEIQLAITFDKLIVPVMLDDTDFNKDILFDLLNIDKLDFHSDYEKKLVMNIGLR